MKKDYLNVEGMVIILVPPALIPMWKKTPSQVTYQTTSYSY